MAEKKSSITIDADTRKLRRELDLISGRLRRTESDFKRSGQQMSQAFDGVGSKLRMLAPTLGAIGGAALARDAAQAGLALDRMQRALLAATGSSAGAADGMAFVRAEAQRLGLDLESAGQQFASLSAAARGTALEGQGARDIFSAVAEASTVMGLSADQAGGALLAIQQIISKGTVSAEELRGQLGERLPGAFQIAARAVGVTTSELGKMLQQGQVVADTFLPAFAAELRRTFGGALPDATRSAQANLNRFRTAVFEAQAAFANSGFLDGVTDGLNGFSAALNDPETKKGLADLGKALGDIVRSSGEMAANFRAAAPLIGTVAGAYAGGRLAAPVVRAAAAVHPTAGAVVGGTAMIAGGIAGNLQGRDIRGGQQAGVVTGRIERTAPPSPPTPPAPSVPSAGAAAAGRRTATPSRIPAFEAELAELRRVAAQENALREFGAAQELAFWRERQARVAQGSRDQIAIARRTAQLEIDILREQATQQQQVAAVRMEAEQAAALDGLDMARQAAQAEQALGLTTQAELLARERSLAAQRLQIELDFLDRKRAVLARDPDRNLVALEELEAAKAEVRRRYDAQMAQNSQQAAQESMAVWARLTEQISTLWDQGVQALLNGTLTWANAFRAIGASLVQWFATEVVANPVKRWLAGEAAKTAATVTGTAARTAAEEGAAASSVALWAATALKNIATSAWEAMAAAWKAMVGIPIVGPALAPAVAAATFAGVIALAGNVSAAKGYDIPAGVNPVTQLHQREMVLPQKYADVIRGMAGGQGGGGVSVTMVVNTPDAGSFRLAGDAITADLQRRLSTLRRGV